VLYVAGIAVRYPKGPLSLTLNPTVLIITLLTLDLPIVTLNLTLLSLLTLTLSLTLAYGVVDRQNSGSSDYWASTVLGP